MKISLNDMVFYGYHGVYDEERRLGQRFVVDVHLYTDPEADGYISKLEHTIDYTSVFADVKEIMETHQFQLLEQCANEIADSLLSSFPLIQRLSVCIRKPSVAIQGSLSSVEVELQRKR